MRHSYILIVGFFLGACASEDFNSSQANKAVAKKEQNAEVATNNTSDSIESNEKIPSSKKKIVSTATSTESSTDTSGEIDLSSGEATRESCSAQYTVPSRANPYFGGTLSTATLEYSFLKGNKTDRASTETPTAIEANDGSCLKAGTVVSIATVGFFSHGGGSSGSDQADGQINNFQFHQIGAQLGKSNLRAPMESLVGVFVGTSNTIPPTLDFQSTTSIHYAYLEPQLNQLFFIGDGLYTDAAGQVQFQRIKVPPGTVKLYLGSWDIGQWNNNSGSMQATLNRVKAK